MVNNNKDVLKLKQDLEYIGELIKETTHSIESEKDAAVKKVLKSKKKQLQYQALFYIEYLWNVEEELKGN